MEKLNSLLGDPKFIQKACEKDYDNIVKLLLLDPDLNIDKKIFENSLKNAYNNKHNKIVEMLIKDRRFDREELIDSLIIVSFNNGNIELIQILLKNKIIDIDYLNRLMIDACLSNNEEIVKFMLSYCSDIYREYPEYPNAICAVSDFGYYKILKLLLEDGRLDPGIDNNTPIRFACNLGHYKTVELLLNDPRVDPSINDNYCLIRASYSNYHKTVKLLLNDPRVDQSSDKYESLLTSCEFGHYKVIKLLLNDKKFNINNLDKDTYETILIHLNNHYFNDIFLDCYNKYNDIIDYNDILTILCKNSKIDINLKIIKKLIIDNNIIPTEEQLNYLILNNNYRTVKLLLKYSNLVTNETIKLMFMSKQEKVYMKLLKKYYFVKFLGMENFFINSLEEVENLIIN